MKIGRFRRASLHVRLALMRFGWLNGLLAFVCVAGVAIWLWGVPQLAAQIDTQQKALKRARQMLQSDEGVMPVVQRSTAEMRLASFYEALGEKRFAEQQLKTLFAAAAKNGLALNQAEYKFALDKDGRYYTYQINLPVKGSYDAIRQFGEQVLLAIPFASLDEINFKREAIANRMLEARVRITLYLAMPAQQPTPALEMAEDAR